MFSGIIEKSAQVLDGEFSVDGKILRVLVERPQSFDDIKVGDSIATNGVCLTVESFDEKTIRFALGEETLKVTGWNLEKLKGQKVNLERSLKLGDRLHGHFVTGHVDAVGRVAQVNRSTEFVEMVIEFPEALKGHFWKKGSVAVNGVSLTINQVQGPKLWVGLIPETLKITNLGGLKPGDEVNLEVDFMARAFINYFNERRP